jgi:integrase
MISVRVRLDTYHPKKDDKYPLIFQIIYRRKKKIFFSPYRLPVNCFDKKEERAIDPPHAKSLLFEEINAYIRKTCDGLSQSGKVLQELGKEFSTGDILDLYRSRRGNSYLILYMENLIRTQKEVGHLGTLNTYQSTLNKLLGFTEGDRSLTFDEITVSWVNQFHLYLEKSCATINTINFYMRILRTVYNRAVKERVAGTDPLSPFREVPIKDIETIKRSIDLKYIKMIRSVDLSRYPKLEVGRDLFLFSFYCRGMSFVDMVFLKKENMMGDTLYYVRTKTSRPLQIKIEKPLAVLIEKYPSDSEYVLPILDPVKGSVYTQYRSALKRQNTRLKRLSDYLKFPVPLTSYVARHTWATLAKKKGVPVSVISQALGHSSEKITYTYLADLDHTVIDTANRQIIELSA